MALRLNQNKQTRKMFRPNDGLALLLLAGCLTMLYGHVTDPPPMPKPGPGPTDPVPRPPVPTPEPPLPGPTSPVPSPSPPNAITLAGITEWMITSQHIASRSG